MVAGFSTIDADRLSVCLGRLTPHLQLSAVALTGGIAMQVGLTGLGHASGRNRIADLDFVATSLEAVSASVVGPFLVSHFHVLRPGVPKFMVQLVDPESRLRIDIFPDLAGSIPNAQVTAIGAYQLPVLPLEKIFEHKVQALSRASAAAPIDPKHAHDARVLGIALRRSVPTVAPGSLAADAYGLDQDWYCGRCELSRDADWPLAPKGEIFELLGWRRRRVQPTRPARS
jgi:hypothetical protein